VSQMTTDIFKKKNRGKSIENKMPEDKGQIK
jgi:hypothetical protein